jgi:hypothetical protein
MRLIILVTISTQKVKFLSGPNAPNYAMMIKDVNTGLGICIKKFVFSKVQKMVEVNREAVFLGLMIV